MGYETRIHVVARYSFTNPTHTGSELATVELGKCGEGPVSDIFEKGRQNAENLAKECGKAYFGIWARTPDRQMEAVEFIREHAGDDESLVKLSDDIEDGMITKDRYDEYLGVNNIDEVIDAFEKDEQVYNYCWTLALLKSIKENYKPTEELLVISFGH